MEKWRQEFERVEEDGDEQGFEELWNKQQCLLNKVKLRNCLQFLEKLHSIVIPTHLFTQSTELVFNWNRIWQHCFHSSYCMGHPTHQVYSSTQDRQRKLFHIQVNLFLWVAHSVSLMEACLSLDGFTWYLTIYTCKTCKIKFRICLQLLELQKLWMMVKMIHKICYNVTAL